MTANLLLVRGTRNTGTQLSKRETEFLENPQKIQGDVVFIHNEMSLRRVKLNISHTFRCEKWWTQCMRKLFLREST